eukprot:gene4125-4371_t
MVTGKYFCNAIVLSHTAPVPLPPAAAAPGYCVPRQSFVVVNVSAIACNPGSNITLWEGSPVCARIDCTVQPDRGNILAAPAFCRTVVEQPRFICPTGCDLIQQDITNTTTNITSTINSVPPLELGHSCPRASHSSSGTRNSNRKEANEAAANNPGPYG